MKAATRNQGDPGLRGAPDDSGGALVTARTIGRFQCEVLLARKGAFETWRARLSGLAGLEKFYAVKCVRPEVQHSHPEVGERFLAGGRRARALRDVRLARVIDAGTIKNAAGDLCFVATEFVQGLSLAAFVAAARGDGQPAAEPLPAPICAHIGAEIARALAAAHGLLPPLPHGRIAPSNLIVTPQGEVRMLDLGAGQAVDGGTSVTDEMPTSGSYLAPELGARDASTPGDLYALGALLHELASGQAPPTPLAAEAEAATEPPVLPAELADVIAALIDPTPERRPDAAAAAERLEGVRDEAGSDVRADLGALAQKLAAERRAAPGHARTGGGADGVILHDGWGAPEPTASVKLTVDGVPTELGTLVADMKPGAVSHPTPVMGVAIATPDRAPATEAVPQLEMAPITTDEIASIFPPEMKSRPVMMPGDATPTVAAIAVVAGLEPPPIEAGAAERTEMDARVPVVAEPVAEAVAAARADRHRKDTVPMPTFEEFAGGTEAEFFSRGDEQSAAARSATTSPPADELRSTGEITGAVSPSASARHAVPRTWLLVGGAAMGAALLAGVGGYLAGRRAVVPETMATATSASAMVGQNAEHARAGSPPAAPQPETEPPAAAKPAAAALTATVPTAPAVVPAPSPVAPSKITIRSNPAGAAIWFAGRERAKTPAELPLPTGAALTLVRPGFQMARITIASEAAVDQALSPTVAPPFGQATLRVLCRTPGRFPVLVDGGEVGLLCPIERLGLRPGPHEVAVFDPATGETQTQHVDMKPGVKTVKFAR